MEPIFRFYTHIVNMLESFLKLMAQAKYFGNVGIDAMLYKESARSEVLLHPIVEVNARKTMGWAALVFQRRHFPDAHLTLRYASVQSGYLPSTLDVTKGKIVHFNRNLSIEVSRKEDFIYN